MLGFRRYFYTKSLTMMPYDRMVAYLTLAFSLIYGVVGSYLLRAQFHGIKSWIDAIYYTIVTYTTLGYGDIYPMTENGKVFTCSMIIVGVCSFLATLTLIVGPLIQKRMQGVVKMVGQFHNLKNHVVFYGYNDLTRKAALKLRDENKLCVFLERHGPTRELIEQDGFSVLKGDGHSNHDLLKVNIEKAREVIFASESDADNILGTMSANECRTKGVNFRIITRVEHEYNIPKARAAGADVVISASQLAGDKIVETVLG
ncbi:MAG: hypothetical protein EBX40_02270 [Gammaproteobacteria bacterium]|nr:hypothetical protein [Gammaproteobacteria bacterium]